VTLKRFAVIRAFFRSWRVTEAGSSVMEEKEFLELLENHRNEFYRFIHRNVWNPSDVDDVFSEAVMVAWQKRASFQKGTNFRAWFYRILLNKSFVFNRHTGREPTTVDSPDTTDVADSDEEFGDHAAFGDPKDFLDNLGDKVYEALKELREEERLCLCMRAMDDCSYKEFAAIMEIPIGTVMTHLSRGRKKMKNLLMAAS
jgi:RNA polymerase sigma-70 factor (ECF subfamily)